MDPSASCTDALVLLHHVNESDDRLRLEVDVPVQSEQEGVLRASLNSFEPLPPILNFTSFLSSLIGSSMIL